MLKVMLEERRRCPEWVNTVFGRWRRQKESIKIDISILKQYFIPFMKHLLCSECPDIVALQSVARLFGQCRILEIDSKTDDGHLKWTNMCTDALIGALGEVQTMVE